MRKYETTGPYLCALILVLGMLVATGCTLEKKKETAYVPGAGKVTVEETKSGESKTTIKSEKGEMTFSNKANPADFDAPFYPGAEQQDSAAFAMNARSDQGSGKWSAVLLKSKDSFEQVVKFYKEKLTDAQAFEASTDAGKTATIVKNTGNKSPVTTVLISRTKDQSETEIHITRTQGN